MPQVRLGGNKASGAKRMYFCLIHAHGDQTGRISAPPGLAPPVSPATGVTSLEDDAFFSAHGVAALDKGDGDGDGVDGGGSPGDEVAAESTDNNQLFRFWDGEANGKLVQAPLDLDRQGRGWCKVCYAVVLVGRVRAGVSERLRCACVSSLMYLSRFPRFRV